MKAVERTPPAPEGPKVRRPRTILVVEDEAIVAEDVRASLEEAGYRVSAVASNRETALENVARERPDLILLDIMLAGGDDGIGVAEAIHARDDVPVVYLTAYSDDALVQRAKESAPYGFLLKPFNERELHATVEMALYHHQLEGALRRDEAVVKQRNLEALGLLAGGIAHDFNNLLAGILGNVELATSLLGENDARAGECMEKVRQIASRARALAFELLTFGSGGAPVRSGGSLAPLLQEASTFVIAGGTVACDLCLDEALWPAYFDSDQINQVIYNLLINAVEAIDGTGTITLGADNFTVEADSPLPLAAGRYVRVTVADDGAGIPADRLAKIFDPYFTNKAVDKAAGAEHGAGLGLAVCHSVIQRHGGCIEVGSEVGVGTTFHLYIPVAGRAGGSIHPTPAARPKSGATAAPGRILVMDDEAMLRELCQRMLTQAGHAVEVVGNGNEALARYQQARAAGEPFDLVILDLTIRGGMGGEETIRRLREIDAQVRAVVMSGYSNDSIIADFEHHGFSAALPKPFTMAALKSTVANLLNGER